MGLAIAPQNYFDILHSIGNVERNLKDKLFRLGRSPHVPILWDVKHISRKAAWQRPIFHLSRGTVRKGGLHPVPLIPGVPWYGGQATASRLLG